MNILQNIKNIKNKESFLEIMSEDKMVNWVVFADADLYFYNLYKEISLATKIKDESIIANIIGTGNYLEKVIEYKNKFEEQKLFRIFPKYKTYLSSIKIYENAIFNKPYSFSLAKHYKKANGTILCRKEITKGDNKINIGYLEILYNAFALNPKILSFKVFIDEKKANKIAPSIEVVEPPKIDGIGL